MLYYFNNAVFKVAYSMLHFLPFDNECRIVYWLSIFYILGDIILRVVLSKLLCQLVSSVTNW